MGMAHYIALQAPAKAASVTAGRIEWQLTPAVANSGSEVCSHLHQLSCSAEHPGGDLSI